MDPDDDEDYVLTPPATPPEQGFFSKLFNLAKSASLEAAGSGPGSREGSPHAGDVTNYWQNYDLTTSTAPDLFKPDELASLLKIRSGLDVLLMRMRIQKRIDAKVRGQQDRAAVRIQSVARCWLTLRKLPELQAQIEKHIKLKGNIK